MFCSTARVSPSPSTENLVEPARTASRFVDPLFSVHTPRLTLRYNCDDRFEVTMRATLIVPAGLERGLALACVTWNPKAMSASDAALNTYTDSVSTREGCRALLVKRFGTFDDRHDFGKMIVQQLMDYFPRLERLVFSDEALARQEKNAWPVGLAFWRKVGTLVPGRRDALTLDATLRNQRRIAVQLAPCDVPLQTSPLMSSALSAVN